MRRWNYEWGPFSVKCPLSSQRFIKNKEGRILEVFTVKSFKPAVRARELSI